MQDADAGAGIGEEQSGGVAVDGGAVAEQKSRDGQAEGIGCIWTLEMGETPA